jgi:short-subunit dehydrogenase
MPFIGSQLDTGDADAVRALFEANYWSPLALTRALVPAMQARGSGVVVNVTSLGVITTAILLGHYSASKAALWHATETLRLELRNSGVRVLHVVPGPVATPGLDRTKAIPGFERMLETVPTGTAEELAQLILRGIERGKDEIVYPRPMWIWRALPLFAKRMSMWRMPNVARSS